MVIIIGFIFNYFIYFILFSIQPSEFIKQGIEGIFIYAMFILIFIMVLFLTILSLISLISIFSSFTTYELDFVNKYILFYDSKFFSFKKSKITKIYFRDINSFERNASDSYDGKSISFRITFVDDIKPPLFIESLDLTILSILTDIPIETVYGEWDKESFKIEDESNIAKIISMKKDETKQINIENITDFHAPNLLEDILFYPILFVFTSVLYCLLIQFLPFNLSLGLILIKLIYLSIIVSIIIALYFNTKTNKLFDPYGKTPKKNNFGTYSIIFFLFIIFYFLETTFDMLFIFIFNFVSKMSFMNGFTLNFYPNSIFLINIVFYIIYYVLFIVFTSYDYKISQINY